MAGTITSLDAPAPPPGPPAELVRRVSEDVALWPARWRQWADGPGSDPLLPGFGLGTGTVNDRKGGRNLPLVWTEIDLRGFRVLSRFLCDTNPFAIGFKNRLTDYHVRKGYGWQACLRGRKKTPYPTADSHSDPVVVKAQNILDAWRDANKWPLRSREAFERWIVDGEVFGRVGRGDYGKLPWFRFVEPEQVGSPSGDTDGPESFGIETPEGDQAGPPVAYHVWDMGGGMTEGAWIDADRITHATRNVWTGVKRGLPDFFPLHEWLDGTRKLLRNMLSTAVEQARIAWREKFPTSSAEQVRELLVQQSYAPGQTAPVSAWGVHPFAGGPGFTPTPYPGPNAFNPTQVVRTEGNREYEPGPTFDGVPGYVQVEQAVLRGAGARWGMPEYFSGDASNNNFASSLVSGSPFAVAVEGGQLAFGECWEKPTALKVLELARDSGLLTRSEWERLDVEVTEPAVVTPEPDKDAQRIVQLVTAKLLSPQTAQLQLQLDPRHEAENWKAFAAQGGPDLDGPLPAVDDQPPDGGGTFEGRMVREGAPGPPPRPGLVWNDQTHRWRSPETGQEEEHEPAAPREADTPDALLDEADALVPDEAGADPAPVVAAAAGVRDRAEQAGAAAEDLAAFDKALARPRAAVERAAARAQKSAAGVEKAKARLAEVPADEEYPPEPQPPDEPDEPDWMGGDRGPERDEYDTDEEYRADLAAYEQFQKDHAEWEKAHAEWQKADARHEKEYAAWERATEKIDARNDRLGEKRDALEELVADAESRHDDVLEDLEAEVEAFREAAQDATGTLVSHTRGKLEDERLAADEATP